jgi:hypothetical protein
MWAFASAALIGQPFLDRQIPSEELDDARHFGQFQSAVSARGVCKVGRRAAGAPS